MGRGVRGCVVCDAFYYRSGRVTVVDGGDTAMEEALVLARFASEVFVIHRREEFRASEIMVDRAERNPRVSSLTSAVVDGVATPILAASTGAVISRPRPSDPGA